jgi:hypothetical protein
MLDVFFDLESILKPAKPAIGELRLFAVLILWQRVPELSSLFLENIARNNCVLILRMLLPLV